jgi:transketolase
LNFIKKNWITTGFLQTLISESKKNKKIIVLDADLADDAQLYQFQKKFPNRFIQNGIAEQDMVSTAGGLALSGLLPVVNSFSSFLISRANEQIFNNSSEKTKIIYICLYAGIIPAAAGKSHQSFRDISLLSNIPRIRIFNPFNFYEAQEILKYCINFEKLNCAIRLNLGSPPDNKIFLKKFKFKPGEGIILKALGNHGLIITYGQYLINEAIDALEILSKERLKLTLVNLSSLNFFSHKWIKNISRKFKKIFLVEDHYKTGGMSDQFINFLIEKKISSKLQIKKIALNDFPHCGEPQEVLKIHGLDKNSLVREIKKLY